MTRKKVKLAYIANDSARKATFKKRKKGLVKKVSELSTLCGVRACAIIYSPYETQPEVWPAGGAEMVLSNFKEMPEMEQSKKMVNQESFLKQRLAKAKEQLKKQHKDNREKEITCLMYRTLTLTSAASSDNAKAGNLLLLQGLSMVDLNDLGWIIDQNLKDIHNRINDLKKDLITSSNNSTTTAAAPDDHYHHQRLSLRHPSVPHQLQPAMGASRGGGGEGGGPQSITSVPAEGNFPILQPLPLQVEEEEMKRVVELIGDGVESSRGSCSSVSGSNGGVVETPFMQNNHQWFMNLLNFGGPDHDDSILPFADPYPLNSLWSASYFP